MKIMTEIGIAANILVFLGSSDKSYSNAQIAKGIKVQADKCRSVLLILRSAGLVERLPEEGKPNRSLYSLKAAADGITLNELFTLFEDELINGVCLFCRMQCRQKNNPEYCTFGKEMLQLECDLKSELAKVTIQNLVNRSTGRTGVQSRRTGCC